MTAGDLRPGLIVGCILAAGWAAIGPSWAGLDPTFIAAGPPGPGSIAMTAGSEVGDAFEVRVVVTGVTDFFGGAFVVAFDPAVATFLSFSSAGSFLVGGGADSDFNSLTLSPGRLDVLATRRGASAGADVAGSELLLRLWFRAIGTTAGSPFSFGLPREARLCPSATGACAVGVGLVWIGGTLTVTGSEAPAPVPDGGFFGGEPMTAGKNPDGVRIDVAWDVATCSADDYNLFIGSLNDVASGAITDFVCSVGTTGHASFTPPTGDIVWVIVSESADGVESVHGLDGSGNPRPSSGVGSCGIVEQSSEGTCP